MNENHNAKLRSILKKHEIMCKGQLREIKAAEHSIYLGSGGRPFRLPFYLAGAMTPEPEPSEMNKLLVSRVIEPAPSAWAVAVLFVPKKRRKQIFCTNYRKLNLLTVRDAYSLPAMDECIAEL